MDLYLIKLFYLATTVTVTFAYEVWQDPCSAGPPVASHQEFSFEDLGEPHMNDMERYQHQMVVELSQARTAAMRLERYIIRRRLFNGPLIVRECQTLPSLMGMPPVDVTRELVPRDFHTSLPYDYQRLATTAAFISESAKDTYGYNTRLQSIVGEIRKSLCLMEIVSLSHGQTIPRNVTHMSENYKNLDGRAMTDFRNCIILRDAVLILENVHDWYGQWD